MSRIYQPKPSPPPVNTNNLPQHQFSKSPSPAPVKTLESTTTTLHHSNLSSDNNNSHIDTKQFEKMEKLVNRLETVAARLENISTLSATVGTSSHSSAGPTTTVDIDAPSINSYNDLLNGPLKTFLDLSNKIGGDVKTLGDMVKDIFNLQKSLLIQALSSAQPSADVLGKALEPLSKIISDIQSFREKNRKSEFFNHLSAVSESIGAIGWVTVTPAPCPFIKEMNDSGQFYTNRVLKDFKEKDADKVHFNWVQSWIKLLNELQAYVKEYHTRGVSWNAKGSALDPSKVTLGSSSSSASASSGPKSGPPGPPPPPLPSFDLFMPDTAISSSNQTEDLHTKLKNQLNMGTDITKNLKKVNDDQKTHKNTALRAGNTVPGGVSANSAKPSAAPVTKPPKFELIDKKWAIEFQVGQQNLVVQDTELKQTVYIYKCQQCTVQIKGKVNSILVDSCERVGVLFDDVLSTIEFVNSKNVQAQVNGKVPTISIDKTDGCQMYLSKQSLEAEIITSKSSAMNILIPTGADGDFTEMPLPEQFKTKIVGNKTQTVPNES